MPQTRTVPDIFRELVAQVLPLGNNTSYWNMSGHLWFGKREEETGMPIVAREILADIEGQGRALETNNYIARRFLEKYSRDVIHIVWGDWNKAQGRARTLLEEPQWPIEITNALQKVNSDEWRSRPRVYLSDGTKWSRKKAAKYRELDRQKALELMEKAKCQEAKDTLQYFNHLPSNIFTAIVNENFDKACEVATHHPDKLHQCDLLQQIKEQALPFYIPTQNSTRLFPMGENIASLASPIRHTLLQGWFEADLTSAQLAIASKEWGVEAVKKFLRQGNSIWRYIQEHMKLDMSIEETKEIFKPTLYSLLFGMTKKNILKRLSCLPHRGRFFKSPLIQALWEARKYQLQEIKKKRGATDAFGNFVYLNRRKGVTVRSVLAQVAQSYELKLLYPVISLAYRSTGNHGFTVTLWQHDGFCFKTNHPRDWDAYKWIEVIRTTVEREAERLGIPTKLEVTFYKQEDVPLFGYI